MAAPRRRPSDQSEVLLNELRLALDALDVRLQQDLSDLRERLIALAAKVAPSA